MTFSTSYQEILHRINAIDFDLKQPQPNYNNTLLSKNIENIQIYVGEFDEFLSETGASHINFKEHPTANHYTGTQHKREWMFEEVQGYFPSFFAYWKKCEKYLNTV